MRRQYRSTSILTLNLIYNKKTLEKVGVWESYHLNHPLHQEKIEKGTRF